MALVTGYFSVVRQPERAAPLPAVATPSPEEGLAADWPMYRGNPARTGAMAGPGPQGQPIELWRFNAQGPASRSPAIAAGVAYLQSGDGVVYALDAATGVVRWRVDLGAGESTPAVVGDTLYVNDGVGALVAFDIATGAERWRFADEIAAGATPIVVDGVLFTAREDGTLFALDAATGDIQWQYDSGTGIGRSPAIADGLIYLGTDDGAVRVVDIVTGVEQWRFESGEADEPARTPTVANSVVYVNVGSTLYALSATDGTKQWRSTFAGARPVTAADDTLYCAGLDGMHARYGGWHGPLDVHYRCREPNCRGSRPRWGHALRDWRRWHPLRTRCDNWHRALGRPARRRGRLRSVGGERRNLRQHEFGHPLRHWWVGHRATHSARHLAGHSGASTCGR